MLEMAKAREQLDFLAKQRGGFINKNELFEASESLTLVTDKLDAMPHIALAAQEAMRQLTDPTLFQAFGNIVGGVFDGMANSISQALNSTENIFQAFGKFFLDFIKGMIIKLVAATIAALALAVVLSTIPGLGGSGVFTAIKAATSFGDKFKAGLGAIGGVGLAEGGIIPNGFPNDTFNARLSSKEAIIPLDKFPQLMGLSKGNNRTQKVEFILEGDMLKALLDYNGIIEQSF